MTIKRDLRDGGTLWLYYLLAILGGLTIIAIVWALLVGTSSIRGIGNAEAEKNSAGNRVAAQERYGQLWNDIQAADRNLNTLAADKTTREGKIRYTGAVNYCHGLVADYDALSQKFRTADYRPAGLPATIDTTNPATDCKEN